MTGAPMTGGEDPELTAARAWLATRADFFEARRPVLLARAPGRLDVMGGIADYSGSLVLELPLEAATFVAAQLTSEECVTARTLAPIGVAPSAEVSVPLEALAPGGVPIDYAGARALLGGDARTRWAAYVIGTITVLARERHLTLRSGVRLLADST